MARLPVPRRRTPIPSKPGKLVVLREDTSYYSTRPESGYRRIGAVPEGFDFTLTPAEYIDTPMGKWRVIRFFLHSTHDQTGYAVVSYFFLASDIEKYYRLQAPKN